MIDVNIQGVAFHTRVHSVQAVLQLIFREYPSPGVEEFLEQGELPP